MKPKHSVHLRGDPLIVGRAANQLEEFGEDNFGGALVEIAGLLVGEDRGRPVARQIGSPIRLLENQPWKSALPLILAIGS